MRNEMITSEATQIARAMLQGRDAALTPADIAVFYEWFKLIAQFVKDCRERRQGQRGQSWQALRTQARDERQVRRIHERVRRRLGPQAAQYGGIETTRYILNRYRNNTGAELDGLIAAATE